MKNIKTDAVNEWNYVELRPAPLPTAEEYSRKEWGDGLVPAGAPMADFSAEIPALDRDLRIS